MDKLAVGVLSDPAYIRGLKRGDHIMSAELSVEAGDEIGAIVYFFSYNDLNTDNTYATAYFWNENRWDIKVIPLPKAIYDRAFSCPASIRRSLMKTANIRFVNEKIGFWKWETHLGLVKFPEISPYLPETYLFEKDEQLKAMLSKYGKAALKPIYGQKAMGLILFVEENGKINFQYRGKGQERMTYFKGAIPEIINIRENFKVMGKEQYIVQQGLELAMYRDRVFDVRALMIKDGNKKWTSTICAKVGPPESRISALGSWFKINELEEYLIEEHGAIFKDLISKIEKLALLTAKSLDKAFVPVGEVGLDIGVDTKGRVWLIEVNSMPAKSMFHEILTKNRLHEIYKLPIQYAGKLASEAAENTIPSS